MLVSLTVIELLVATTAPLVDVVLTLTVNVSLPSVVTSANGVTTNDEVLLVIVNNPKYELKSALLVETLLAVQYKVVPLSTKVVTTLNVKLLPSLILVAPPLAATEYVGGTTGRLTVYNTLLAV
jgi:hypothetical protein